VLFAGAIVAAVATALLPETAPRRPGAVASLRPRVGMPPHLRAEFGSITPILLASWALGGPYLSLGPSVAAGILGVTDHLVGGLVAMLLCGTGALTALLMRGRPLPRVAANVVGLGPTALVYGGVVVALSLLALVARLRLRTRQTQPV
jgi:hypothetical protein